MSAFTSSTEAGQIDGIINVSVIVPGRGMNNVCASRSATIRSVKSMILPHVNADLLYKGQLMVDELSLDCYELQPDDLIVAVERISGNSASLQLSGDGLGGEANAMMIRRENCRMRDLLTRRREMKPRAQRKFVNAALRQLERTVPRPAPPPTITSGWERKIGSSPLPVPW